MYWCTSRVRYKSNSSGSKASQGASCCVLAFCESPSVRANAGHARDADQRPRHALPGEGGDRRIPRHLLADCCRTRQAVGQGRRLLWQRRDLPLFDPFDKLLHSLSTLKSSALLVKNIYSLIENIRSKAYIISIFIFFL